MAAQPAAAASPERPPQLASAVRPGSGGAMTAMVQTGAGLPAAAAPKRARARAKPAAPRRSAASIAAAAAATAAAAAGGDGDGDVGSAVLAPGRMPIPMVDEQGNPLSKEQALARPHLAPRLRPPPLSPWLPPLTLALALA